LSDDRALEEQADPVVVALFADLQLAEWTRKYSAKNRNEARAFERQVWHHLMHYLTTLERPDLRAFDWLED
jgi:predicted component of type VI protein secretion system